MAGELDAFGGYGLYIDFTTDYVLISDQSTPANNYSGTVAGKLTLVGSPTFPGPNGGLVPSGTTKYARLATSAFPWNYSEGTIAVELIRTDSGGNTFLVVGQDSAFETRLGIRRGPTANTLGMEVTTGHFVGSQVCSGRIYLNLPSVFVGAYKDGDCAQCCDGRDVQTGTESLAADANNNYLRIGVFSAAADYCEILRVWYIPTRLSNTLLTTFVPQTKQYFYIDSVAGSDSNDGLSSGAARASLNDNLLDINIRHGDVVRLKYGSEYFPGYNGAQGFIPGINTTFEAYGTAGDGKPRISGARVMTAGSWTAEGSANVWKQTQTHSHAPVSAGLFAPGLWRNRSPLTGYWGGGSISANIAYVSANAGTFTCHKSGSTTANPASDTVGTDYVYYMHSTTDPTTDGNEHRYGEAHNIVSLYGAENISDIEFFGNAHKDFVSKQSNSDRLTYFTRCEFNGGGAHGVVSHSAHHVDCSATARPTGTVGGGIHFFRDTAAGGTGPACSAIRCTATGYTYGFYSHGTDSAAEQASVTLTDCESVNCSEGIETGKTTNGWIIAGHTFTNCTDDYNLNYSADQIAISAIGSAAGVASVSGVGFAEARATGSAAGQASAVGYARVSGQPHVVIEQPAQMSRAGISLARTDTGTRAGISLGAEFSRAGVSLERDTQGTA